MWAALHAASDSGRDGIVEALIKHDKTLDVNVRGSENCTALEAALRSRKYAVVRLLLSHKDVDVNVRMIGENYKALHMMCRQGNIEMGKLAHSVHTKASKVHWVTVRRWSAVKATPPGLER